jgi:sortase A
MGARKSIETEMLRDRAVKYLIIMLVLSGTGLTAHSGYFYAKGILAQYLLNRAWEESRRNGKGVRAWSWADTYPVGRLRIPSLQYSQIVLEGINNESLAFGPAHLLLSSSPGEGGNIVIMGHRDSFFRRLAEVREGDMIELESLSRMRYYTVTDVRVIYPEDMWIIEETSGDVITLVTCYPFDFIGPAPQRYVVRGTGKEDI